VRIDPRVPVCTPDGSCVQPVQGVLVEFIRRGRVVRRVRTRDDGTFSIRLAARRYAVRLGAPSEGGRLTPRFVRAQAGRTTRITFTLLLSGP
jgi:hypothetical protein